MSKSKTPKHSDRPRKEAAAAEKPKEKPKLPKLPPGTQLGHGSGGVRTSVQVPILDRDTHLSHGSGGVHPAAKPPKFEGS